MNYAILASPANATKFANCVWLSLASGKIFLAQDGDYRSFCAAVAVAAGTPLPALMDPTAVSASILTALAPISPPASATSLQVAQAAARLNPGFASN